MSESVDVESVEIDLLVEAIRRRWGYDFRHYSRFSLARRLRKACESEGYSRLSGAIEPILHDQLFFDKVLRYMSITVTEMFRNPDFYEQLRSRVITSLRSFPFVKIWHAGCATGEEVYSMAIMLHEEGILPRTRIYATDFNKDALDFAKKGVYPLESVKKYERNYRRAGGQRNMEDYFAFESEYGKIKDFIKKHVTFSYHNLTTDGAFGEMHVIFCRNVLIYFDKTLQERSLKLFAESLRPCGVLCLGNKETPHYCAAQSMYDTLDSKQRIYKKRVSKDIAEPPKSVKKNAEGQTA